MHQAMKIKKAKEAVDAEWQKLVEKPAWSVEDVEEAAEVIARYRAKNVEIHFATLMDLCHERNAELPKQYRKYNGSWGYYC